MGQKEKYWIIVASKDHVKKGITDGLHKPVTVK